MKKIVTLGGAVKDIFIEYENENVLSLQGEQEKSFILLEEGKKIEAKQIEYHVGGGAANAAVAFSRLGFEVQAIFKIAQDETGTYIIDQLSKEKVSTKFGAFSKKGQTGVSFIIPSPDGNKAIIVYRDEHLALSQSDIQWDAIAHADQLYITSLYSEAEQLLLPITQFAKKHSIQVAVNPGADQLVNNPSILFNSLPFIDILILNSNEIKQCMYSLMQADSSSHKKNTQEQKYQPNHNLPQLLQSPLIYQEICFNLAQYFHEILRRGPKIVVVTNGPEGVYIASGQTIYFYPSPSCKVKSTVGAGDAFGATFVASLLNGKSIEQALIAGNINSCSVIGFLGAQTGLLYQDDLEESLAKANLHFVKKFNL